MKKNLILIKFGVFFTCVTFLIILSVLNKSHMITSKSYFVNGIFTVLSISISIILFVIYKKECKKCGDKIFNLFWIIVSLLVCFLLYFLYCIPLLGFIRVKGVNNSVLIIFIFTLFTMFIYDVSYYVESRLSNSPKTINSKTDSLGCFFRSVAVYFISMAILASIVNFILPKLDVSMFYQFAIEHKSFEDIIEGIKQP